jgi:hypothetical protein
MVPLPTSYLSSPIRTRRLPAFGLNASPNGTAFGCFSLADLRV